MIRPLRTCHRRAVTALAVVLAPLTVLALLARPQIPVASEPSRLAPPFHGEHDGGPWPPAQGAWRELGWSARVVLRADRSVLELRPLRAVESPDVLVYLASDPPTGNAGDGLPADARLLGSIGSQPRGFVLPATAGAERVVFYSLGHRRVLGDAPLPGR